jgi:hypothetical protein
VNVAESFFGSEVSAENYEEQPQHCEQDAARGHFVFRLFYGRAVGRKASCNFLIGHPVEMQVGSAFVRHDVCFEIGDSFDVRFAECLEVDTNQLLTYGYMSIALAVAADFFDLYN